MLSLGTNFKGSWPRVSYEAKFSTVVRCYQGFRSIIEVQLFEGYEFIDLLIHIDTEQPLEKDRLLCIL